MLTESDIHYLLETTFPLVFIAFAAGAFFLFLERDRVPEDYKLPMRVSIVYLTIAAVNYYYMMGMYEAQPEGSVFPTSFRYIDWLLTTPLMLLKFPLVIGIGEKGKQFMVRLVALMITIVITGWIGEVSSVPAVHYGFFFVGCLAWFGIMAMLFTALTQLPDDLEDASRTAVRHMSLFILLGWAVYPIGYLSPLLGVAPDIRELVYNVADFGNKLGLCLVIYLAAKRTAIERVEAYEEEMEPATGLYDEVYPGPAAAVPRDYERPGVPAVG